jgi:predicted metalloprotease
MADWSRVHEQGAVEDRRRAGPVVGISLTAIALYLLVSYLSGADLSKALLEVGTEVIKVEQQKAPSASTDTSIDEGYRLFASKIVGSGDALWQRILGGSYRAPTLVLFRGSTQSRCGGADSHMGPHYCPADETIYLDETFFEELTHRFGAKGGDVAQAYVIAHEMGHHVQQVLHIRSMQRESRGDAQQFSINQELQADCYAGIWAKSVSDKGILEPGEIEEAVDAARAVGDDRIQKRTTGSVNPETWTHGSSADRMAWFTRGYTMGSIESCNTFGQ